MEEHTNGIAELLDRIKRYCDSTVVNKIDLTDETKTAVNLSKDDIDKLSSEQCHVNAYLLHAYCNYLASKAGLLRSQLVFLNDELEKGCSKYWNNYDQKLPWEIKRSSIISENSYLTDIHRHKTELTARLAVFDKRFDAVKGQAESLDKIGDRKRFG